jgi:hypothetical protein
VTGSNGKKRKVGLDEVRIKGYMNQKMAELYLHPYIHTYIHTGTISGRTGEVENDSDSSYISHQPISLTCNALVCNRLTRLIEGWREGTRKISKDDSLRYNIYSTKLSVEFHMVSRLVVVWLYLAEGSWLIAGERLPKGPPENGNLKFIFELAESLFGACRF